MKKTRGVFADRERGRRKRGKGGSYKTGFDLRIVKKREEKRSWEKEGEGL